MKNTLKTIKSAVQVVLFSTFLAATATSAINHAMAAEPVDAKEFFIQTMPQKMPKPNMMCDMIQHKGSKTIKLIDTRVYFNPAAADDEIQFVDIAAQFVVKGGLNFEYDPVAKVSTFKNKVEIKDGEFSGHAAEKDFKIGYVDGDYFVTFYNCDAI